MIVHLFEWRSSGHRLGYARAVARSAESANYRCILWTTSECVRSVQFATHLADLERSGALELRLLENLGSARQLRRALSLAHKLGGGAVLPEADRLLSHVLLSRSMGRLPKPTSIILMRPPQLRRISELAKGSVKTLLIGLCLLGRSIDVHFLEDPLAYGNDRAWRGLFAGSHLRLDDPADLTGSTRGPISAELVDELEDRPTIGVFGSIDERKRIPLAIQAWQASNSKHTGRLLIAGHQSDAIRSWLLKIGPLGPSVVISDRYIPNEELTSLVHRVAGILILYDHGVSSGILVVAAAAGKTAICLDGSRESRVAVHWGFGETSQPDPISLARTIDRVINAPTQREPIDLPSSLDFGNQVLRRFGVYLT